MDYIEYLGLSGQWVFALVGLLLALNVLGEFLSVKGKVVPEIMTIRKYFARKKQEREAIAEMIKTLPEVKKSLNEFNAHYSADNMQKRNDWMKTVNDTLKTYGDDIKSLDKKLDKTNADTLTIRIENMRDSIISFAGKCAAGRDPLSKEQFNRVFTIIDDYEKILTVNDMQNGQVNVAHRIINETYEQFLHDGSFIEDVRGY